MKKIVILFFILCNVFSFTKMKIGVTLQPYYSYVTNIVGDKMEVVPVIRGDLYDSHSYRPRPEDIKKMTTINALVVNGIGHDEFVFEIVKAAKVDKKIKIINANKGVALMPVAGMRGNKKIMNAHSFISITASIQQVYTIAKELSILDPKNKDYYNKNAQLYAQKLRKLKADAIKKINHIKNFDFKIATSHGGYDYLLSEFGLKVKAVVEPSHGIEPSASDIKAIIDIVKKEKIDVLFVDAQVNNRYSTTVQNATGVKVRKLSHMSSGAYTKESFEKFMQYNLDSLTNTLLEIYNTRKK